MTPASEIGRELLASDLKPREVVVTVPSWVPHVALTLWVWEVSGTEVLFYSGTHKVRPRAFRTDQDTLVDGRGRLIRVFEYLGEL
jgi:hypothetical protein